VRTGDLVILDLGPNHPAQLRRAVRGVCEVVAIDPPWCEVRAPGDQPLPVETFLIPLSECRVISLSGRLRRD
jgi:hypothetical protein